MDNEDRLDKLIDELGDLSDKLMDLGISEEDIYNITIPHVVNTMDSFKAKLKEITDG